MSGLGWLSLGQSETPGTQTHCGVVTSSEHHVSMGWDHL